MRKLHIYKDREVSAYLKGLKGRETAKNVVWDQFMQEKLEFMGFSRIDMKPASIVDLSQVEAAFEQFHSNKATKVDLRNPYISEGINLAYKNFGGKAFSEPLLAIDIEVVENFMKLDTSAGLTMFGSKKCEAIMLAVERAKKIINGECLPKPCLAGIRTQMKDDGNNYQNFEQVKMHYKGKTRLVWMYPTEMTVIEGMFAIALIDRFKKNKTPMAIGLGKGEIGARVWNEVLRSKAHQCYALDYSKYDSTISADLIRVAFRILRSNFVLNEWQEKAWNKVVKYFIHTPIVFIDGYLYVGKEHGVPSGSFFTQLIDSVVNCILLGAMSKRFGLVLDSRSFMILGDDVILGTVKNVDLVEIEDFLAIFGIIMHADKTEKKPHFLGAVWYNAIPTRKKKEVLTKMVYPENYRTVPEGMEDNVFNQLLRLSYSYCYWNLNDLVLDIRNKRGEVLVDNGNKWEGISFEKIDWEAVVDRMPGYYKYTHRYVEAINFGRPITSIQFVRRIPRCRLPPVPTH